jgi:hypothetical protein
MYTTAAPIRLPPGRMDAHELRRTFGSADSRNSVLMSNRSRVSLEPDFGPWLNACGVVGDDIEGYFLAMKSADPPENHSRCDDHRNHCNGDDPEGQFSPKKLARHSANINMSYWERLSYAGK